MGDAPPDALVIDFSGRALRRPDSARIAEFVTRIRNRAYRPILLVRIDPLALGTADQDLDAVMPARPDGIILAAAPDGAAVQQLGVKLAVREATLGVPEDSTAIVAECGTSAMGLLSLGSFAGASVRLAGLMWDAEALAGSCGGARDAFDEEGARSVARTLLLLGASAAGVPAFDTAMAAHGEIMAKDCRAARRMGYSGKVATSAPQVAVINAAFARSGRPAGWP